MGSENKQRLRSAESMARQLTEAEQEEYDRLRQKHPSASVCMWSLSMLQKLDNSEKGWKWFSLKDKIWRLNTISFAFGIVRKNKGCSGIDKVTIEKFSEQYPRNLISLSDDLENDRYEPLPVKRVLIDKPGSTAKRPLGIPTVKQRVVENAIKFALEPIFETMFLPCSYGFRPNRGAKDALRVVTQHLNEGYKYVVDADIKGYFDTIDHNLLMSFVEERIADKWVLTMLKKFLGNDIMEEHKRWKPTVGSPQGSVISPLLSNIYLHRLDERMTREGFKIIRYADDFVIMCKTAEEASRSLEIVKEVMSQLKLTLHPEKTKIVEVTQTEGFEFLGYHFTENKRRPRDKTIKAMRDKIKEQTPRKKGKALLSIIKELNPKLRGWYNYFKNIRNAKWVFVSIDSYTRRRLRTILAKHQKKRGSHRMSDNYKWKNDYFHSRGLFSLLAKHEESVALARGDL
jgi:RNA-directed DNA polymerase